MREKVENALKKIRPALQADGGDIELISVSEDGVVNVRLQGACHGCPMAQITLQRGVKKNLMQMIPEVSDVVAV
ncbi:NifU family protein [candidate division KSB1 bacterium]|nr:NifU family protein [candidate division KSB1 bacterium]